MNFKIAEQQTPDGTVLVTNKGKFETTLPGAVVEYKFDASDNTIQLNIEEFWFDKNGVEDLIRFLEVAKTQL